MLIIGVEHDRKHLEQIVSHMRENYPLPKSIMIESSSREFHDKILKKDYTGLGLFFWKFLTKVADNKPRLICGDFMRQVMRK